MTQELVSALQGDTHHLLERREGKRRERNQEVKIGCGLRLGEDVFTR